MKVIPARNATRSRAMLGLSGNPATESISRTLVSSDTVRVFFSFSFFSFLFLPKLAPFLPTI
jgi:hypothetical protein